MHTLLSIFIQMVKAAPSVESCPPGAIKVAGECIQGATNKNWSINDILTTVLGFLTPIAGILIFINVIWGGFDYMFSQGNPKQMQNGKMKITYAIIGFIILVLSHIIVNFIAYMFGVPAEQNPLSN